MRLRNPPKDVCIVNESAPKPPLVDIQPGQRPALGDIHFHGKRHGGRASRRIRKRAIRGLAGLGDVASAKSGPTLGENP
jgi:hypothetical protein